MQRDVSFFSSLRYYLWGTVRYANGTTPTKYQFTGQYSFASEFGLLDYKARFYDPYLNRWTSPDSIVPEEIQGVQAWDRYCYVNNSPLKYQDPSGHYIDDGSKTGGGGSPLPIRVGEQEANKKQWAKNVGDIATLFDTIAFGMNSAYAVVEIWLLLPV